jgi:hypothetical protein
MRVQHPWLAAEAASPAFVSAEKACASSPLRFPAGEGDASRDARGANTAATVSARRKVVLDHQRSHNCVSPSCWRRFILIVAARRAREVTPDVRRARMADAT